MRIVSILENQKIEKRIAITPEIAKKYISLGLEVSLPENYAKHLGISNNDLTFYTKTCNNCGVKINNWKIKPFTYKIHKNSVI